MNEHDWLESPSNCFSAFGACPGNYSMRSVLWCQHHFIGRQAWEA